MPHETPREQELSEQLARATAEVARVAAQLGEMRIENRLLREKMDALVRRLFGAQSEKLDAAQLLLMLQGVDDRREKPRSPWKRRHHGARRSHRLRVNGAARACPSICRWSRK